MLSFEKRGNALSVVLASPGGGHALTTCKWNTFNSKRPPLLCCPAPLAGCFLLLGWRSATPWPSGWCWTRRIILPLLRLTFISQRPGCKVIYIPKQQVMFFETGMWASSWGAILRKGQICVAAEKGEAVHWEQCKGSRYWLPGKTCTAAESWSMTGICTNWL